MNKRFLVRYLYRGKQFTVAFSEGTTNKHFLIGKKITVGSDSSLLWQIFNPSFPQKHDLIVNDNGEYYFNLLKSFSIQVKKGDKELDLVELKSLGLLKDNRLYLKEDYSGSVIIDENTTIDFKAIPKEAALTTEQKKLVALWNRWPQISTQQKVTRFTIASVILFIIIFASIVGWTYTPPVAKNIFDRTEESMMVSMQVEDPIKATFEDQGVYTEPEEGAGEEEAEAEAAKAEQKAQEAAKKQDIQKRIAQRRKATQTSTTERYQAAGAGGGATGAGDLVAVKNRVRGIKGSGNRNSSFNVDVDTGSEYGEIAASLNRKSNNALNTAVMSDKGISARDAKGRSIAGVGTGVTGDLEQIASNIGGGEGVKALEATEITGEEVTRGTIEQKKRERKDLTNSEKETQIREWFMVAFLPRINQEFDRYKLRKTIRGELNIKLIFKNDKIIKAIIRGKGSINDKDFIARIEPLFNNKSFPNIGDYQIDINNLRFE